MSPTDRLNAAPRRHARSKRTGKPCQGPAVTGWRACRFHGAQGGAPRGPSNGAFSTGLHTKEAIAARQHVRDLVKRARTMAKAMVDGEAVSLGRILTEDAQ